MAGMDFEAFRAGKQYPLDFEAFMGQLCTEAHLDRMLREKGMAADQYKARVAAQFLDKDRRALDWIARKKARDPSYVDDEDDVIRAEIESIRAYINRAGLDVDVHNAAARGAQ